MRAAPLPDHLLSDTEATLRLVDAVVAELTPPSAGAARPRTPLLRLELLDILQSLRDGRDLVRHAAAGPDRAGGPTADALARAADILAQAEARLDAVVVSLADSPDEPPPRR